MDLVRRLATATGIDTAIETGTFMGEGALLLREVVPQVWTIEIVDDLHQRAVARYGSRPGVHFLHGESSEVLRSLSSRIDQPAIFWLDAHGGMTRQLSGEVFNPLGESSQCPVLQELAAIRSFPAYSRSCLLIDDARAFLGPLPQHTQEVWPTLADLIDVLRADGDRYITILDDVVIAVPPELRGEVDQWWLEQVRDRDGRDGYEQTLWDAYNPTPTVALRRLIKSVVPRPVRRIFDRYR